MWVAASTRMHGAPQDFEALHSAEMFVRECYPKTKKPDDVRAATLFVIQVMRMYGLSAGMVNCVAYTDLDIPGWGNKRLAKLVGRFAEWMHGLGDMSEEELHHVLDDVEAQGQKPPGSLGAFVGGVRDVVLRPADPAGKLRDLTPPRGPDLMAFLATQRDPNLRGMARAALEYATALFCHYTDSDTPQWEHFGAPTFLEVALEMRAADPNAQAADDVELEEAALRWLALYVPWLAKRGRVSGDVARRVRNDCLETAARLRPASSTRH